MENIPEFIKKIKYLKVAHIINLKTNKDQRGSLTVINDLSLEMPFLVKRIYFINEVDDSIRGGHRHKSTIQAAICINGSCKISNNDGVEINDFILNDPSLCLILEPKDWHQMSEFSENAILLVFASEPYDKNDYIYEKY